MKIPAYNRPNPEDFGPDRPNWFERFLRTYHKTMEGIVLAVRGRCSFDDNLHTETVELELEDDTAVTITLQDLKTKPVGATLIYSAWYAYPQLKWQHGTEELKVNLAVKWDVAPTSKKKVRIVFWGA